jgi:AraC family transcriptional regulator, arabinose operon regulatory protein
MDTARHTRPEGFPGQRLVIVPREIISTASGRPVTRDLCVTHIGAFHATAEHFVERPQGTPQQVLIACLSGRGHCRLDGREWLVETGDLVFLPPKAAHSYRADARAPWTIFWIHFRGLRVADHLENLGVTRDRPVFRGADTAVLMSAFEDTYRHVNHGFGEAALTGLSTGFARLLALARIHRKPHARRSLGAEDRVLETLALMRGDPARPWTLEDMAREAAMSPAHFTELCRRQTGMPPVSYLIRLRLQRATDLLARGHHNVAEAAREVGYEDPFYFSRLFRRHLGMPPSSFRLGL